MALTRRSNRSTASKKVACQLGLYGKKTGTRLCAEEEGQALLEVTASFLILVTLLFAIYQLGIIYNAQIMLTQAAGTSVQYLSSLSSLASSEGITDPCASTISNFQTDAPNLNPSHLTVTVSLGGGAAVSSCTVAQLQAVTTVKVNANYTCSLVIPTTTFTGCNVTANPSMTVIQ